ncbi:MAG: phytanoyl-CoA dioxygenase family protein [Candidatus Acidiferrales bacterium]
MKQVLTPTTVGASAVKEYQERGYILLEDAVDPALISSALENLRRQRETGSLAQNDRYNRAGKVDFSKTANLVKTNEAFRMLASEPRVVKAVETLLGQRALIFRDVLVNKPARTGASLDYHQDSAYWDVEPRALISAWFTFRDVGPDDGCLRVISGSQTRDYPHDILVGKNRALPRWMTSGLRRLATLSGTGDSDASGFSAFRRLKNKALGSFTRRASFIGKLQDLHARVPLDEKSRSIELPVREGSVLLFHSQLLHASNPNTSEKDRPAYIVSYMGSEYTFCGVGEPEFLVAAERDRKVFQKVRVVKH